MSRRSLTHWLAALLALGLAAFGGSRSVPYVVLQPGPAFDTLGKSQGVQVLSIKGQKSYPTDGSLDLTTVSVLDGVTLAEALRYWWSRSDAVVPREVVYPPNQDRAQTDAENARAMVRSHDDATTAALRVLGIPGTSAVTVVEVAAGLPSDGLLQVRDVISAVDGLLIKDQVQLREAINAKPVGSELTVGYLRAGKPGAVKLLTRAAADDPTRAVIGVSTEVVASFPITVDIKPQGRRWPSAPGLMFALGIVDKLGPDSLTGGRHIAGTGEITPEGVVGAIGGIPQKMRGAERARGRGVSGACGQLQGGQVDGALRPPTDQGSTLKGALAALSTLRSGGVPPTC